MTYYMVVANGANDRQAWEIVEAESAVQAAAKTTINPLVLDYLWVYPLPNDKAELHAETRTVTKTEWYLSGTDK